VNAAVRRVRLVVSGRVQGVWYRGSMEREALRLGVTGWVKNRSDGTVEAVAEGGADAIDELVAWCRKGPPSARVDRVEVHEEAAQGLAGFRVTR
jgi:acylphosphatase